MITPSSHPQFRMSQGIVCSSPTLTVTPYMTDAWSFNRPIERFTYQEIYDEIGLYEKYVYKNVVFEEQIPKEEFSIDYKEYGF